MSAERPPIELRLAGYCPKRVVAPPAGLGVPPFNEGRPEPWEWPGIDPEERAGYRSLGVDVVGKTDFRIVGSSIRRCRATVAPSSIR